MCRDKNKNTFEKGGKTVKGQWIFYGFELFPGGQNRRESSPWECIFDNMALYFECRTLLPIAFLAILPTGSKQSHICGKEGMG